MTFEKLLAELQSCFSSDISAEKEGIYRSVLVELELLFYNGVIYVKTENSK